MNSTNYFRRSDPRELEFSEKEIRIMNIQAEIDQAKVSLDNITDILQSLKKAIESFDDVMKRVTLDDEDDISKVTKTLKAKYYDYFELQKQHSHRLDNLEKEKEKVENETYGQVDPANA